MQKRKPWLWKILGRALEIIAISLIVVVATHFWINKDLEETEVPGVSAQPSNAKTETSVSLPSPASNVSADTGSYQYDGKAQSPITANPTGGLNSGGDEDRSEPGSTIRVSACDFTSTSLPAESKEQQIRKSDTVHVLRIATVAPEGSAWMQDMRSAAQEIQERTDGRVRIKYYGGGIKGNDSQVLNQVRIGYLQGGTFTPSAFQEIYPDLGIYGLPLMFRSADEATYVREHLDGLLLEGLRDAGFVSFGFAAGGYSYLMSKSPIRTLSDLAGKNIWVPEGDEIALRTVRALSMSPVSLPLTDVLGGLQTGLIETFSMSPIGSLVLHWHTQVEFISDVPIVYAVGFIAIDAKVFNKIDSADQELVTDVMNRAFCNLDKANSNDNRRAYDAMLDSGIQSVTVSPDELGKIRNIVDASNRQLVEQGYVSRSLYERELELLRDFRSRSRGQ